MEDKAGMESPEFFMDEFWSLMQQTDCSEIQLEGCESDFNEENIQEASSSSSELIDSSSFWTVSDPSVHDKNNNSGAACTQRSQVQITSCLGKRNRSNELKAKVPSRASTKESKWAVQLLNNCAEAIASNNVQRTQHLMWVLNDLACLTGDANQRLAAYGLKAFMAKLGGTIPVSDDKSTNIQRAFLKFHDLLPLHQMVYTVTNGVVMDVFEHKSKIHVIDIGVSQGTHWPTLIEALASRPSGPPGLLRLTIVDDVEGPSLSAEVKNRLERFAKVMGLNMELCLFSSSLGSLTRDSFQLQEDEAVAVCVHFRLSKLSIKGKDGMKVSDNTSARDEFLNLLRMELDPDLLVLAEQDCDNTGEDFLTLSREVVDHYWRLFDSISVGFKGEDCEERKMIEQLLSRSMIDTVGAGLARKETHTRWNARMKNAGFAEEVPHDETTETVRMLVKKSDPNWEMRNDRNCLVLFWKQQPVTFCSVWKR